MLARVEALERAHGGAKEIKPTIVIQIVDPLDQFPTNQFSVVGDRCTDIIGGVEVRENIYARL